MAAFDAALLRAQFPAFANATTYPDAMLDANWDTATLFVANESFPCKTLTPKQLAYVLNAMTCHLITMFTPVQQQSVPGAGGSVSSQMGGGFTTSATVGKVSVSKLAPPVKDGWEFWLEQTPYGAALLAMLQGLAVGGFSVGGLPESDGFRRVYGVFF